MKKNSDLYGILYDPDLDISLFKNYKDALQSYLQINNFKHVKNKNDLNNLNYLFIIDELYKPNLEIWSDIDFINYLNKLNIKVIIFNFEKVYKSIFRGNLKTQKKLEKIKYRQQFFGDIEDAKKSKNKFISKQLLSKKSKIRKLFSENKLDRILFLGSCELSYHPNNSYAKRYKLLEKLKRLDIPLDIEITQRKLSYEQFLETLSKYKYILNPLGTGNFLNVRFYEALELGCIPIQQVTKNMLCKYPELKYAITFNNANDFKKPIKSFLKMDYYLEDYFEEINLKDLII